MSDEHEQADAKIKAAWFELAERQRLLSDSSHNPDDYSKAAEYYDKAGGSRSAQFAKLCREIAARLQK